MVHPPDAVLGSPNVMPARAPVGVIRFTRDPNDPGTADVRVVLDTTWTPSGPTAPDGTSRVIAVRDIARKFLSVHDLIAETSARLDRWAETSGVIDQLTIGDTSFWFYVRLRHWAWLEERILWAGIIGEIVRDLRPASIVCSPHTDVALADVLRLAAARDGIELTIETLPEPDPSADADGGPSAAGRAGPATPSRRVRAGTTGFRQSALAQLARRVRNRVLGPPPQVLRQQEIQARVARIRSLVDALEAEPEARLLVVHEHARQRVETPDGPRSMNPYLDPIVDRLRGTRLEPIVLDIRARAAHDAAWERVGSGRERRILPLDALVAEPTGSTALDAAGSVRSAGDSRSASPVSASESAPPPVDPGPVAWRDSAGGPVDAFGIDLGPLLAKEVAETASRWLPGMAVSIERIERFLARLQPAGIVLADEYHRQDWMAAAGARGIPVAAVQHGMIYRHHNGYIHAARPATLRLPQRTYVFGRWERDLLRTASVYRDDEVNVGGSPRLDFVVPDPGGRERIRAELGIGPDERLVLLSGTWGGLYRRFHYPIALAALVDRPLPGVHFVVKLHPGEPDEGPYRAIIEGAAAAGGFASPPITIVQSIDLYRLLSAADAHLGIHSTVLTEAVVTRTPNLLVDGLAGADLLGYVPAGVALPVHDGAGLLAALDAAAAGALTEADAAAFADAHFEPGSASERIAASLEDWLR